eukprot:PITA_06137
MANEKIDTIEQKLDALLMSIKTLANTITKGKSEEQSKAYAFNENIEVESSHSLHLFRNHQQYQPQPPKLDMYKFDRSHPATWLAQMEQYFTLNHIRDDATQLSVGSISDKQEHRKNNTAFETLAFRTAGLRDEFYLECFVSSLKEAIQAPVRLQHLISWLDACKIAHEVERALAAQSTRPNFIAKGHPTQAPSTTQTLKVQKVSPTEIVERRKQGLCYYCDEKYSLGHKCKEPKFFQIDATDLSSSEEAPPIEEPEEEDEDHQPNNALPTTPDEPVILIHALAGISSAQTLKIRGFIKHRPVVVLIDSGSMHNFIHQRVAEVVHSFVRAVPNFQVQIVDGGTMKCEGRCENVKLQMGDYQLKTHMFSIHMGGCGHCLGC